ncbi:MAG: tetratricopeptide repeat protein, partial [Planctomycetales bacterium]|nr:tetratricopeptide repeat protein [Planctomycetales bacterium]
DAIESFRQAVALAPDASTYWYNLGRALKQAGDAAGAIEAYANAVDLKPEFFEAQNNLANLQAEQGDAMAAIDNFLAILNHCPDKADVHFNLANVLLDIGQTEAAIAHFRQAIIVDPDHCAARDNLGRAYIEAGRDDEAVQVCRAWLAYDPANSVAQHMLSSLTGNDTPSRCGDEYVRTTFDKTFAECFDQRLQALDYRAPELTAEAVRSFAGSRRELDVLDAGCGTGLCGPLLRAFARHLIGVDLSADMLQEAERRQVYDQTCEAELTQFLQQQTAAYDVIVSADTLCYFGDLGEVLLGARRALRPQGGLIFTVEQSDSDVARGYELQRHGRYAHVQAYVTATLAQVGLELRSCDRVVVRKERGQPVHGLLVTATRSA